MNPRKRHQDAPRRKKKERTYKPERNKGKGRKPPEIFIRRLCEKKGRPGQGRRNARERGNMVRSKPFREEG